MRQDFDKLMKRMKGMEVGKNSFDPWPIQFMCGNRIFGTLTYDVKERLFCYDVVGATFYFNDYSGDKHGVFGERLKLYKNGEHIGDIELNSFTDVV